MATVLFGEQIAECADDSDSAARGITCQVKQLGGRPTLFIDGEPRFPMAYVSYYPQPFRYKQMAEHGVHFYSVTLTLTDKWLGSGKKVKWDTPGIWQGPDKFDLSIVDAALKKVISEDPKALIFIRIYCDCPTWWEKLHPDDCMGKASDHASHLRRRQSFSSETWRNDAAKAIKAIVLHVSKSKYADHVFGYMPGAGQTEELAAIHDPSACSQRRFREWIWKKYGHDEKTIRRLFAKKIDKISVPLFSELHKGTCGNLLDPQKSRLAIDYREFHSKEIADSAIALCEAVKTASQGRLLAGVFYGYTRILPDRGHLALRRILESDAIDFVSTPHSHGGPGSHLQVGNFDFQSFTQANAVQKAGKLFYRETDIRTSTSRWISETRPEVDPAGEYRQKSWLGPPTMRDSLELLKGVYAKVLTEGWANWWFDLWGGWYDDEQILRLFAQMQQVGDESLRLPRKSVAQIAVLLDENAYRYIPYGVANYGGRFAWINHQLSNLAKVGAPYDFYLLDDIEDLDLSQYRMLVFLNPVVLSDAQRQTIRRRCMSDNRLLIWMYAPGLIKDNLSVENMPSLLKMKFQMEAASASQKVTVKLQGKSITYQGAAVAPFIYVSEGSDTAPGHTDDGRIVVAEKNGPHCLNLFAAMPPLPVEVLQYYAKTAGVHLYNETGVVVLANQSYLAVAAPTAGKRTIRLPKKAALVELLTADKCQSYVASKEFDLDFTANSCRLFRVIAAKPKLD